MRFRSRGTMFVSGVLLCCRRSTAVVRAVVAEGSVRISFLRRRSLSRTVKFRLFSLGDYPFARQTIIEKRAE